MIDVKEKIKNTYFDYIHNTTNEEIEREAGILKTFLKTRGENKPGCVLEDERLELFFNKLTQNIFSDSIIRAKKAYGEKNVDINYCQNLESICSEILNGEMLLEMFIDGDKNLALSSISIKEPLNSLHTLSDFLVFSSVNNLFVYEPDMFTDTVLGRIYTGDTVLKYTENLALDMKIKITVNPGLASEMKGCVLKAKYNNGVLVLEKNIDIKENRDCILNLNEYDANFDWLEIIL